MKKRIRINAGNPSHVKFANDIVILGKCHSTDLLNIEMWEFMKFGIPIIRIQ